MMKGERVERQQRVSALGMLSNASALAYTHSHHLSLAALSTIIVKSSSPSRLAPERRRSDG